MAASFVTLHDQAGRRMFSFDADTDPEPVVLALAWAFHDGIPCCAPRWGCPTSEGSYCLDCHTTGHAAVQVYRRRFGTPS